MVFLVLYKINDDVESHSMTTVSPDNAAHTIGPAPVTTILSVVYSTPLYSEYGHIRHYIF